MDRISSQSERTNQLVPVQLNLVQNLRRKPTKGPVANQRVSVNPAQRGTPAPFRFQHTTHFCAVFGHLFTEQTVLGQFIQSNLGKKTFFGFRDPIRTQPKPFEQKGNNSTKILTFPTLPSSDPLTKQPQNRRSNPKETNKL